MCDVTTHLAQLVGMSRDRPLGAHGDLRTLGRQGRSPRHGGGRPSRADARREHRARRRDRASPRRAGECGRGREEARGRTVRPRDRRDVRAPGEGTLRRDRTRIDRRRVPRGRAETARHRERSAHRRRRLGIRARRGSQVGLDARSFVGRRASSRTRRPRRWGCRSRNGGSSVALPCSTIWAAWALRIASGTSRASCRDRSGRSCACTPTGPSVSSRNRSLLRDAARLRGAAHERLDAQGLPPRSPFGATRPPGADPRRRGRVPRDARAASAPSCARPRRRRRDPRRRRRGVGRLDRDVVSALLDVVGSKTTAGPRRLAALA